MDGEQLKQVLTDHRLWFSSDKKQGKRADLSRANLTGAKLTDAKLTGSDLTDANLYGADLTDANLTGVCLTDANLYGADLTGANLSGANLSGADLTGANLSGAKLTGSDLRRANLTGAELGLEIRECYGLKVATVSEDQLAWLCLHPGFGEWRDSLTIVPSRETEMPTT